MPNPYFKFKQFTVWQDQTAMKVCTDACVLGAWADVSSAYTALDIGTGTGLLALMLAQRNAHLQVDAVEIDASAYHQAVHNVVASPFKEQISVFHQKIQGFSPQHRYDLIVSNPPFFQNSLHTPKAQRNKALHAQTLNFDELLTAVTRLLAPNGYFVVLLPPYETNVFAQKASLQQLKIQNQLYLLNQPHKEIFRAITTFGFAEVPKIQTHYISIRTSDNLYSWAFIKLLRDFYLIF